MKKEDVNPIYSLGNLTVSDLAREFGVSTRTIHCYLSSEYKENLPKLISSNVVVLMDTYLLGKKVWCCYNERSHIGSCAMV